MHRSALVVPALAALVACNSVTAPAPAPDPDAQARAYDQSLDEAFELTAIGTLKEEQEMYTKYVRFGQMEEASDYVVPELQGEFRKLAQAFREVRVIDVYTEDFKLSGDTNEGTFVLRFQAYSLSQPFERSYTLTQRWLKDVKERRWRVIPDIPKLREIAAIESPDLPAAGSR